LELVQKYSTKWRLISKEMEGRTGLTCRNRWRKLVSPVVKDRTANEGVHGELNETQSPDLQELSAAAASLQEQSSGQLGGLAHVSNKRDVYSGDTAYSGNSQINSSSLGHSTRSLNGHRHSSSTVGTGDISAFGGNTTTDLTPMVSLKGTSFPPTSTRYAVSIERDSQGRQGDRRISTNHSQRGPNTSVINGVEIIEGASSGGSGSAPEETAPQIPLSFQELQSLVQLASKMGQKLTVHQHNYYYSYPDTPHAEVARLRGETGILHRPNLSGTGIQSQSPSLEASNNSSRATPLAPPTPGFLELELMDMAEDAFEDYGDPDLSIDIGNFHGIPFNPS
jgi:hypothetical protein